MSDQERGCDADGVFRGRCVGGPHNGLFLASRSSVKCFYRPYVGPVVFDPTEQGAQADQSVRMLAAGQYTFKDHQWVWEESAHERMYQQALRGDSTSLD